MWLSSQVSFEEFGRFSTKGLRSLSLSDVDMHLNLIGALLAPAAVKTLRPLTATDMWACGSFSFEQFTLL